MATEPTSKPFWNRPLVLRLRVRGLIVLIVVIACGLGWIDYRARIQREIVKAIKQDKGWVYYDRRRFDSSSPGPSRWPNWVENTLGEDLLHDVTEVYPGESPMSDEFLAQIGRLKHLDQLSFDASNLTDASLAHLSDLSHLTQLNIVNARQIRGTGLESISKLTRLKHLRIVGLQAGDADLAHLAKLSELLELRLHFAGSSRIGDAGMAHLGQLRQLQHLQLYGTEITTQGLMSLQGLTYLGSLSIEQARITSLEPLKSMPNLNVLGFRGNPINDDGLAACASLPRLERLLLAGDLALTDAGMIHLNKLPRLKDLELQGTNVGDQAAIFLAEGPIYLHLNLSDTHITDVGIAALAKSRSPRSIAIKPSQVTPAGTAAASVPGSNVSLDTR